MSSFVGFNNAGKGDTGKTKTMSTSLNNLFGMPDSQNEVVELSIDELVPYKFHEWEPSMETKRDWLRETIRNYGVMQPIIVRPKEDIEYPIDGNYEIIAGHQRTQLSRELGKTTIPAIVKRDMTQDEIEDIVFITNIQRSFEEMSVSKRASLIAKYYERRKRKEKSDFVEEISMHLESFVNPVESADEADLSPGGTNGIRGIAEVHDLSKNTIARYIRIDTLIDGLKEKLDNGSLSIKAAVELSYVREDYQEMIVELLNEYTYKCDLKKAKLIRETDEKDQLDPINLEEILAGKKAKKNPGKRKNYKLSGSVIQKYFKDEQDEKKISEVIEEALKMYFGEE